MSKKINLYWYKHNEGHGNFGDALNPYLINKLSTNKVNHYDISLLNHNKYLNFKILLKALLLKKLNLKSFLDYLFYDYARHKKVILAIGSILRYQNGKNFVVWGSGIIKKDANFGEANFLAVRGKYTKNRLAELGYNLPLAYGDPALLLPLVYSPKAGKQYKLGIIPHFIHYKELIHLESDSIKVINLLDPIEKVIDEINSCCSTISTSLHGIIVSHCYKIPSLWFTYETEEKLFGDDIKFKDYFSSVNLKEYSPFQLNDNNLELNKIDKLFEDNTDIALVNEDILSNIQKGLINCAPFDVNSIYTKC